MNLHANRGRLAKASVDEPKIQHVCPYWRPLAISSLAVLFSPSLSLSLSLSVSLLFFLSLSLQCNPSAIQLYSSLVDLHSYGEVAVDGCLHCKATTLLSFGRIQKRTTDTYNISQLFPSWIIAGTFVMSQKLPLRSFYPAPRASMAYI